jgi:segregation and condensation protein B
MLRLVRDDQTTELEELAASEDGVDAARQAEPAERADGEVADASEAEESSSDEAVQAQVDAGLLEALLLSTHHPLTAGRIGEVMGLSTTKPVRQAIKELNRQYEESGRSFRIEQVAGGYQILTLPQYGEHLKKLHQKEADAKLTKAALETLAIIAYKQPVLRADVEAVRGCACGETIRSLMEKHLVKIAGRAEEPGRPILYGTTKRFLELFGLNTVKDLPQPESTKAASA